MQSTLNWNVLSADTVAWHSHMLLLLACTAIEQPFIGNLKTLTDYRRRYATYRLDWGLQVMSTGISIAHDAVLLPLLVCRGISDRLVAS
jgi:hypothetical protein